MSQSVVYRVMLAVLTVVVVIWSTLNHFIFEWSGNSKGTAWMAATDESVFQHLKMMLWPWLFLVLPFDLCWRRFARARMGFRGKSWPSFATILASNATSIAVAMLFMSVFFAIMWYGSGQQELLVPNIILFLLAVVGGLMLRLALFDRPTATVYLLSTMMLYGMVWIFTYTSYRDNLSEGFWFDPHEAHDD